jgi:predicted glycosyltransferase
MKILIYCQHVLGVGHFFRILEIAKALSDHEVILVSGAMRIHVPLPGHVREVFLDGLMMNENFGPLQSTRAELALETVQERRKIALWDILGSEAPDLFLVELYPFGRKAFRFELDPVLSGIRSGSLPPCRVVCSLRDILVEKEKAATHEARAIQVLNTYFDGLLIHADPRVLTLDLTFERAADIRVPVVYTGFVAPRVAGGGRPAIRQRLGLRPADKLVVASAGGGKVGAPLLKAVVAAGKILSDRPPIHIEVFAGPYLDEPAYAALGAAQGPGLRVRRFAHDFLDYLTAADLSISMAGYNTCMDILAAQVPALVWPFAQNREQRLRAERLARLGAMEILETAELFAAPLSERIRRALAAVRPAFCPVDLNGAAASARQLGLWMAESGRRRP